MFKTTAQDSVGNAFVNKDVDLVIPGTRIVADDQNIKQDELVNAVESAGLTLDAAGTKRSQIAQAMQIYGSGGATFCIDSGAADEYVLALISPRVITDAYFDGQEISFIPAFANAGASTVNVEGLGIVDLTEESGDDLTTNRLSTTDRITGRYNLSSGRFEIVSSKKTVNVIEYISTTTWSPPSNLIYAIIEVFGASGGAGGCEATGAGESAISIGGQAGGYAKVTVLKSILQALYNVVVGTKGIGGAAGNNGGGDGGDTKVTFGSGEIEVDGAGGGAGGAATSSDLFKQGSLVSGGGGAGGGGDELDPDITVSGGYPSAAINVTGGHIGSVSDGAASKLSRGSSARVGVMADIVSGDGGGPGGSALYESSSAIGGRDGAGGRIIITEFLR